MADESNELRATLARLHEQLGSAQNVSAETRDKLRAVLDDLQQILSGAKVGESPAGGPISARGHASVVERLKAAEREFEATHPTMAGMVGSILSALGQMGI